MVIKKISVIGAGLMGSGIAQVCAQQNLKTVLIDTNNNNLIKGKSMIMKSLERISKKTGDSKMVEMAMGNISTATTVDSCRDSDLVVEAIVENLGVKHTLFKQLDLLVKEGGIFASNTSSLSIKEIAKVTKRGDKFVGLHFFNPVPQMKLVEIIRTQDTLDSVYNDVQDFVKLLNKVPVSCQDTPGYLY